MATGSKKTTDAKATEDEKLEAGEATQNSAEPTEAAAEGSAPDADVAADASAKLSSKQAKKAAKKAKKAAEKAEAEKAAEAEDDRTSVPVARRSAVLVGVIFVSVIMVGSCLLPSLSAIISGIQNAQESSTTEAATSEDASTESSTDDAETEAETTNSYMDSLDETYQPKVEALEAKLEENAEDKATLINLANTYLKWADTGRNYASSDADTEHVNELLTKAEGYYDSYLALDNASAARVSRALCQYYLGETDAAIKALKAVTADDESYAPAWTNLGMIYEDTGDTDAAKEAYNKAIEADPNDTYGLQSYASSQLSSIESEEEAAATAEASE